MRPRGTLAAFALAAIAAAQDPVPGGAADLATQAATAATAGKLEAAVDLYRRAIELEPRNATWILAAGRCLQTLRRFDDELDLLEPALQRLPESAEIAAATATAYNLKAEDLLASGVRDVSVSFCFEEAARVAETALRNHPQQRELHLALAQSLFQLGDMQKALAAAEEVVRRFPSHPGGHLLVGKIAYREFVEHRQSLNEGLPRGAAGEQLLQLAKAARDRATQAFTMAISLDPDRWLPHAQLGDIEGWVGNSEQALRHYATALAIDAGAAVDHSWIASRTPVERRVDFYTQAAAAYRARPGADAAKAATLDWWLAFALNEKKKFADAFTLFDRAATANPDYITSRCWAMLAAFWNDQPDRAEQQAVAFANAEPRRFADHVRAATNSTEITGILEFLARRAYEDHRLAESRAINHVLALVLDAVVHWNNYAFLCRETADFAASYDAYTNALLLEPDSPQLLNDAALVLHYHLASPENLVKAGKMYRQSIAAAQRVLADAAATAEAKGRAQQALTDATANLAKLGHD